MTAREPTDAGDYANGASFAYRHGGLVDVAEYRLALWRRWDTLLADRLCVFVMLNPSTATHTVDDPTIRRCIIFAKRWGFTGMAVVNLFGLRSTDPRVLRGCADAEGDPWNLDAIRWWVTRADRVVCAWGNHGALRDRGAVVSRVIAEHARSAPMCFRVTNQGQPEHPLYQPTGRELVRWEP